MNQNQTNKQFRERFDKKRAEVRARNEEKKNQVEKILNKPKRK